MLFPKRQKLRRVPVRRVCSHKSFGLHIDASVAVSILVRSLSPLRPSTQTTASVFGPLLLISSVFALARICRVVLQINSGQLQAMLGGTNFAQKQVDFDF